MISGYCAPEMGWNLDALEELYLQKLLNAPAGRMTLIFKFQDTVPRAREIKSGRMEVS